jgi:uncharacterized repeat protein (TIGR01451 family)
VRPTPVTVGNPLINTVTTINNGPDFATGVTLTNSLPTSVSLVSASAGYTASGNVVVRNIGDLAPSRSALPT